MKVQKRWEKKSSTTASKASKKIALKNEKLAESQKGGMISRERSALHFWRGDPHERGEKE